MIPFQMMNGNGLVCPQCGHNSRGRESTPPVPPVPSMAALADVPYLESLNEEQRNAACYEGEAGAVLVLAGAGCGKTRTMVARAIYLLSRHRVQPHRIAMLTFTRRAAREVQERLAREIPGLAQGVFVGTFHSFCLNIIHRCGNFFSYSNLKIIDAADQEQLIGVFRSESKCRGEQVSKQLGILPNSRSIASIFSYVNNKRSTMEKYFEENPPEFQETVGLVAEIARKYQDYKTRNEYLDFDDILSVVADKLAGDAEFRRVVQSRYDYILVDEMQDTSPVQWEIVKSLYSPVKIFCVGDDAQSIYGFRGADFDSVHHFCDKLPNAITLKLTENYRSTQEILDLANALLLESPLKYGRVLHSSGDKHGMKPKLMCCYNEDDEASFLCSSIKQKLMSGVPPREIMVLLRSASNARILEFHLNNERIPYRMIGGVGFLQAAHVKDVLSTFEALTTVNNEMAWQRFLTLLPGIGFTTASRLVAPIMNGADRSVELANLSSALYARCGARKRSRNPDDEAILQETANFIDEMSTEPLNPGKCMEKVIVFFRNSPIMPLKYDKWHERDRDLDSLLKIAQKFSSVSEFLEPFKLDPNAEHQDDSADRKITLITVHSAKGTEADCCYVMRVQSGNYPHIRASSQDEIEEERRVLYVALTRARKELLLTRVKMLSGYAYMPYQNDFIGLDLMNCLE